MHVVPLLGLFCACGGRDDPERFHQFLHVGVDLRQVAREGIHQGRPLHHLAVLVHRYGRLAHPRPLLLLLLLPLEIIPDRIQPQGGF
jgi:hypothetical protein